MNFQPWNNSCHLAIQKKPFTDGTKYSRMDPLNFLKAVFHKFYWVHSWIVYPQMFYSQIHFCPNKDHIVVVFLFNSFSTKLGRSNKFTIREMNSFETNISLLSEMFE